jgi:hypothetical protein
MMATVLPLGGGDAVAVGRKGEHNWMAGSKVIFVARVPSRYRPDCRTF